MRTTRALAALLAQALAFAPGAHADPPRRRHLEAHAAFVAGGGLAWILSETAFKSALAPAACRWCTTDGFDTGVRDALVWRADRQATAGDLSSATAFVLAPGVALAAIALGGPDRDRGELIDDALVVGEAGVAAALVDQAVKFAAGRERPFVRFAAPGRAHQLDDDVSFFSGHTALAFALVTAGGTIASRRDEDAAPWLWAGGLTIAAATGYLRVAADQHWATDVLAGAAAGAAIGLGVPRLLHDHDRELTLVPTPDGVALTGTF